MKIALSAILVLLLVFPRSLCAQTLPQQSAILQGVGIDQHLGVQIPLDLQFHDETGKLVRLRDLSHGKPVLLTLVYLQCPMLCTVVLNDALNSLKVMPLTLGQDYDVWTISFDPHETSELAARKKPGYVKAYNRTKSAIDGHPVDCSNGWRFLTGDEENIHRLTEAVGFHYRWDEPSHQYFHPAGVMILTPDAKISRYFFGIDYDPTDLRLALVDASGGTVGHITDKLLLYCYCYDPATGKYGLAITNALRVGAGLTVLALTGLIYGLIKRERHRPRPPTTPLPAGET